MIPFRERIHPPKAMTTTSNVDSCDESVSLSNIGKEGRTIVGLSRAVKGTSFIFCYLCCNDALIKK